MGTANEENTDFYANYLATRLKYKTKTKMDLGRVNIHEIPLLTFWNLCLSDKVLTETEYKAAMESAYEAEDRRKEDPKKYGLIIKEGVLALEKDPEQTV